MLIYSNCYVCSYEIGEIYAALTLIDFGPTSALCDHHSNKSTISCYNEVSNELLNNENYFNIFMNCKFGKIENVLYYYALYICYIGSFEVLGNSFFFIIL